MRNDLMETIRAKVLNTDYDESRHLIKWLIQDTNNNREFTIAWLDEDLGNQFGITSQLSPDVIRKFCRDMTNKEFNLVMNSSTKQHDADFFEDEKKVSEANDMLETYPFREVIEQIEESSLKVRLFGLDKCEECKSQQEALKSADIPFFYVDSDADENQDLCDKQEVDSVPHIQLLHGDKVVFQKVGFCDPKQIIKLSKEIGSNIK